MDTIKNYSKKQAQIVNGFLILALASTMFAGTAKAAHSTFQSETESSVTAESRAAKRGEQVLQQYFKYCADV